MSRPVVAMDANALMMPVELDVRVFDELDRLLGEVELVTPRAVVDELARLSRGGGREARAASVALDLATDRCRVIEPGAVPSASTAETDATADDTLVDLARRNAIDLVVTNDRPLRDRLRAVGVPVIGVRGRNTLAIARP